MMDYFNWLIASKLFGKGGSTPTPSGDELSDVMFYDYDGTVLYRYSKDEFLALSEMPPNPTREGLIAQGWNWSIEDAKSYVANYGIVDIGQMYITDDGATRFHISLNEITGKRFVPQWYQTNSNGVIVDWGDGTPSETSSTIKNTTWKGHTYDEFGDYIVSLLPIDDCIVRSFDCRGVQSKAAVVEVNFGKNIRDMASQTYSSKIYGNVTKISCPISNSFYLVNLSEAYALKHVNLATTSAVTETGISLPLCECLRSVSLPFLSDNYVIQSSTSGCHLLKRICLSGTLPSNMSICKEGYGLQEVSLPESVSQFYGDSFRFCNALGKLTIPRSVTSIGGYVGAYCWSLRDVYVLPTTPPSLGSYFLYGVTNYVRIHVPAESLEAYKSATNWSACADQMVGV